MIFECYLLIDRQESGVLKVVMTHPRYDQIRFAVVPLHIYQSIFQETTRIPPGISVFFSTKRVTRSLNNRKYLRLILEKMEKRLMFHRSHSHSHINIVFCKYVLKIH